MGNHDVMNHRLRWMQFGVHKVWNGFWWVWSIDPGAINLTSTVLDGPPQVTFLSTGTGSDKFVLVFRNSSGAGTGLSTMRKGLLESEPWFWATALSPLSNTSGLGWALGSAGNGVEVVRVARTQ